MNRVRLRWRAGSKQAKRPGSSGRAGQRGGSRRSGSNGERNCATHQQGGAIAPAQAAPPLGALPALDWIDLLGIGAPH